MLCGKQKLRCGNQAEKSRGNHTLPAPPRQPPFLCGIANHKVRNPTFRRHVCPSLLVVCSIDDLSVDPPRAFVETYTWTPMDATRNGWEQERGHHRGWINRHRSTAFRYRRRLLWGPSTRELQRPLDKHFPHKKRRVSRAERCEVSITALSHTLPGHGETPQRRTNLTKVCSDVISRRFHVEIFSSLRLGRLQSFAYAHPLIRFSGILSYFLSSKQGEDCDYLIFTLKMVS